MLHIQTHLRALDSIGEGVRSRQVVDSVLHLTSDKVVERGGLGNSRGERLNSPKVTQGLENRGSLVRLLGSGHRVSSVVLDVALRSIGADQPGGHTATQTVKIEGVVLAVGGSLGVGLVVRADSSRGSYVVEETTCLIEGNDDHSLVPLGAGADSVVDLLDENLAEGNVARGVHGVGVQVTARGVDVRELGKKTQVGILQTS